MEDEIEIDIGNENYSKLVSMSPPSTYMPSLPAWWAQTTLIGSGPTVDYWVDTAGLLRQLRTSITVHDVPGTTRMLGAR